MSRAGCTVLEKQRVLMLNLRLPVSTDMYTLMCSSGVALHWMSCSNPSGARLVSKNFEVSKATGAGVLWGPSRGHLWSKVWSLKSPLPCPSSAPKLTLGGRSLLCSQEPTVGMDTEIHGRTAAAHKHLQVVGITTSGSRFTLLFQAVAHLIGRRLCLRRPTTEQGLAMGTSAFCP